MSLNIATSSVDSPRTTSSPRLALIARAAESRISRPQGRVTRTAKAHRENMRAWRKKAKAKGVSKIPPVTESPDHTCPLCLESFKTGAAYMNHFAERRFGEGELHVCMTRQQMRESANLVPDWDTGAWAIRR